MLTPKVDISLLKRLVAELESSLAIVEVMQTDINADYNEFVVEAAKASGLAAGIMQEATIVLVKIHDVIDGQTAEVSQDFLTKILGPLKPVSSN